MTKSYLQKQYKNDKIFLIKHNYLKEQFSKINNYLKLIKETVKLSDFTLGDFLLKFENKFKKKIRAKYAVGVGSGTDALRLSLQALNIGYKDEVILPSFTFYASLNPIISVGAKPVFVDSKLDFNINEDEIINKINKNTRAIMPVHWAGKICNMKIIKKIAKKYNLKIIEDACHAYLSSYNNIFAGNFGDTGCFSLHPLKNVNVWGDGGVITTNNKKIYKKLLLLRNHGLKNRNELEIFGHNSRLDTIQAAVGFKMLDLVKNLTKIRRRNAQLYDNGLKNIKEIYIPPREKNIKQNFQLYSFLCKNRNGLIKYLHKFKIDAKIHYPKPLHLQKPCIIHKYNKGKFPVTVKISKSIISIPVHEYIKKKEIKYVIEKIKNFYE
jgi:dTDP-4-amino-4,6-dideoxygalactose transaminase